MSSAVLDPCASGPCLNGGTCSSTQDPVSYHCTCPLAFTGKDCGTGEGTRRYRGGAVLGRGEGSPCWGGQCLPEGGELCRNCRHGGSGSSLYDSQKNALTRPATSIWRWVTTGPVCRRVMWSSVTAWRARPGAKPPATQVCLSHLGGRPRCHGGGGRDMSLSPLPGRYPFPIQAEGTCLRLPSNEAMGKDLGSDPLPLQVPCHQA